MEQAKEANQTKNLYLFFWFSLIASIIPHPIAAIIALAAFMILLIAAYVMRGRIEKTERDHSLLANHTTNVISAIWIATGLSVITITLASLWMIPQIDYSAFEPCANNLANLGAEALNNPDYAQIEAIAKPCFDSFITANNSIFVIATLISGAPILAYLAYRAFKGIKFAMAGESLPNPCAIF